MPRPAMPQEVVNANKIKIIQAASDMIRENGISSVTARSLGSKVDMNSALIYRYFTDIDEVILFACVNTLRDYSRDMYRASKEATSDGSEINDLDLYLLSWDVFCKHAFAYPEEFLTLFFSKHSEQLYDVIGQHLELFPYDNLKDKDVVLHGMFRTASLRNRNLFVLHPILGGIKTEDEIMLINDMTVAFFYSLLLQLTSPSEGVTPDYQRTRMLRACRYLLDL